MCMLSCFKRVKLCAVCTWLFFARRGDTIACSRKCANLERIRRFRRKRIQYTKNHKKNRKARQARVALRASALVMQAR
jgi:hypothetical protein